VVGYAGLAVYGEEGYVQTVAVAPAARRAGVGTRLVVALLREAHRRQVTTCGLEVRTDNAAARSLYGRLGFRQVGVRRGYYQPSGADAYVMVARGVDAPTYADLLDRVEGLVRR
ncbi:MAG TPA: ribosomal protein S18-alanine N-acetyltransferase, partial [Frankiaceae bacterium]|nr:ribosomal protein S18-alanine N-acetyltransferase [Frankiaceae bacterium]